MEAPIHDHRAIELVNRLIQTVKRRLSCVGKAAKKFNLQASIV